MNEQMEFSATFEDFAKEYGFKDNKEVYTNGSDLIPIFRVKQWLEHDNKLREIEIDTAYECGKHAIADKMSKEIEELVMGMSGRGYGQSIRYGLSIALEIIDKYKAESEGKN